MDVHAVVDELDGHPGIEGSDRRPRLALAERAHRVEQVGGQRCSRVEPRPSLVVRRVGVPDGHGQTRGHQLRDERQSVWQLGRHSDRLDPPVAGLDELAGDRRVGCQQVRRILCATTLGGQERPLHVETLDHAVSCQARAPGQLLAHRVDRLGHERHQGPGRSATAMEPDSGGHRLGRGRHVVTTAAVDVQVDEARQEPASLKVDVDRGRGSARPHRDDPAVPHRDPPGVEHPTRRDHSGSAQDHRALLHPQPFTAPEVRPAEIRLWNSTNRITTGSEVSVAAAINPPKSAPWVGLDWKPSR